MKLKSWAILLTATVLATSQQGQAQYQMPMPQYGVGLWGGMQPCAGYGQASGASNDGDYLDELKQQRSDLRRTKRDLEREIKSMIREQEQAGDDISSVVQPMWAKAAKEHMDKGLNCCVIKSVQTAATTLTVTGSVSAPVPVVAPPPAQPAVTAPAQPVKPTAPAPPGGAPTPEASNPNKCKDASGKWVDVDSKVPGRTIKKRDGFCGASNERPSSDRMPANVESTAPQRAGAEKAVVTLPGTKTEVAVGADQDLPDNFGGGGFGSASGGQNQCGYPKDPPYWYPGSTKDDSKISRKFGMICEDGGIINENLCRVSIYLKSPNGTKTKDTHACARAVKKYKKLVDEIAKKQRELDRAEDEIASLDEQIKDESKALKESSMETDCENCRKARSRKNSGPSNTQLGIAAAMDVVSIWANYRLQKSVADNFVNQEARTGNNYGIPYNLNTNVGAFWPYRTSALMSGANGAYGCSPTMYGGGSVFGPYGMASPYAMMMGNMYGGANSPFGYPQNMFGYPTIGGGMFNPGYAPQYAMPWLTANGQVGFNPYGYPNPYAGAMTGGQFGIPGAFGNGYPNSGFPNIYAGGQFGMPNVFGGNPMYGNMGGIPGLSGYPNYGGMPGMSGFPNMGGFPNMTGIPGLSGSPFGMGQTDMSSYNLYLQAQQQQLNAYSAQLRLQQGFSTEYMQLYQKYLTMFGSGSALSGSSMLPSTIGGSGPLPSVTVPVQGRGN